MDMSIFYPGSQSTKKAYDETANIIQAVNPTVNEITECRKKIVSTSNKTHNIGIVQGAILGIFSSLFMGFLFRWSDNQSIYDRNFSIIFAVVFFLLLIFVGLDIKKSPSI